MNSELYKALYDLFQACSNLCLDDMNKLEKEINAASLAIKNAELTDPAMTERIAKLERLLWKSKRKIMQLHDEIMIDNEIKCIGEKCTEVIFCQEIDEVLREQ